MRADNDHEEHRVIKADPGWCVVILDTELHTLDTIPIIAWHVELGFEGRRVAFRCANPVIADPWIADLDDLCWAIKYPDGKDRIDGGCVYLDSEDAVIAALIKVHEENERSAKKWEERKRLGRVACAVRGADRRPSDVIVRPVICVVHHD
jgi:hypothetical protein